MPDSRKATTRRYFLTVIVSVIISRESTELRALVFAKFTTEPFCGSAIGSVLTDNSTEKVDLVFPWLTTAFFDQQCKDR
jgi:hypothetical protein